MTYKLAYKISPHNESRLTLWKVRRKSSSLLERAAECLGVAGSEVACLAQAPSGLPSLLDIRSEFRTTNSSERCNSHARTEFGHFAVSRIFQAAGALDRFDSERNNYLFLTATLPGNTDEAKWAIAEYSHEIIDGLKSWLSKRLSNRMEFYVWENQGRGALHFHYCIYCPDKSIALEIGRNFKRQMVRLYDGIGKKHDCNLWGKWSSHTARYRSHVLQARVEVVYKSVGAYMAGYLGGKENKHSRDSHHPYYPKRWYGVSRPLSKLIDSYTEEVVYEFDSLKEANENLYKIREDLLDDALTSHDYPHKIGEGRTHVSYHTQENQQLLWQSKKMLTHSPSQHPNISNFIANILAVTRNCATVLQRSKSLQDMLPPKCVQYLQDSSLQTSLRRGAVSRKHIQAVQELFSSYDWSSHSQAAVRRQYESLRMLSLQCSQYHSQMLFNQFGWLNNTYDFVKPVDKEAFGSYARTSYEEPATGQGPDSSGAHVASEPKPCPFPSQISLNLFSPNP